MFFAIQRQTKMNIFTEKQYITVTPTYTLHWVRQFANYFFFLELIKSKSSKLQLDSTTDEIFPIDPYCKKMYNGGLWGNSLPVVGFEWKFASKFVYNLLIIEVSLSLIGWDVTKLSPTIVCTGIWDGQYM